MKDLPWCTETARYKSAVSMLSAGFSIGSVIAILTVSECLLIRFLSSRGRQTKPGTFEGKRELLKASFVTLLFALAGQV